MNMPLGRAHHIIPQIGLFSGFLIVETPAILRCKGDLVVRV